MPGNFHSIPASVIATWPKPNYVDPVRREWLPAFAITWQVVSTIMVWCRFYLRYRRQAGEFGFDDALIFVGWLFSVGVTTTACIDAMWFGLDRHTWDVPHPEYVGAALVGWIAQVMFITSTCAVKLSVLLFYRRMVKDTYSRKWLYALWTAISFTIAVFFALFITYCFICQPLSSYWLSYDFHYHHPMKCIDGNALTVTSGIFSALSDIYAVLLPCIMLRHYELDIPRRQRIALNFIFGLGILVGGAGIARTYYLWKINHTYDTSWTGYTLFVWSVVECQLALVCACAPSLRVFFRHYLRDPFKRGFQNSSRSKRQSDTIRNSIKSARTAKSPTMNRKASAEMAIHEVGDGAEVSPVSARSEFAEDTRWGKSVEQEFESYAMRQLARHGSVQSTHDSYLDPRRQQHAESAV